MIGRSGTIYTKRESLVNEGSPCGPTIPGSDINHNISVVVSTNTAITKDDDDKTSDFLPLEGIGDSAASVKRLKDLTKDELLDLLLRSQKKIPVDGKRCQ